MLKVISFGEVLIDMLSNRIGAAAANGSEQFTQYPGGAPANVAVAVARLGGDSHFAGKVGDDQFGRFLLKTLTEHGVNTDLAGLSSTGKTAIAFVSLDQNGERTFSFYGVNAAHLDFAVSDLSPETFAQPGIFHFSSNTLTEPHAALTTEQLAESARQRGCLVSFDINYRAGLWDDAERAPELIARSADGCDLLKASREELHLLYGEDGVAAAMDGWLRSGVSLIAVTDGGNAIEYKTGEFGGVVTPPNTKVLDTTAAGDAFVGGLLCRIAASVDDRGQFSSLVRQQEKIESALTFAARCGAFAVSQFGAFTSLPTLEQLETSPHL